MPAQTNALALACVLAACSSESVMEPPPPAAPVYDGKNRAISFDGANDYASTGSAAFPVGDGPHTIVVWVRPARVTAADATSEAGAAEDQAIVTLRKDEESGVVLGLRRGAFEAWSVFSGRTYARASSPAVVGVWQHVAYSFDRTMHRIFVDGRQLDAGLLQPNNRTPTTGWLGTLDGSRNLFVGELDAVGVYSVALDPSAVAAQAMRSRTASRNVEPLLGIVLWLGFDEVSGKKAFDISGRGNDALLGDGIPERMPERSVDGVFEP